MPNMVAGQSLSQPALKQTVLLNRNSKKDLKTDLEIGYSSFKYSLQIFLKNVLID